MYEHRVLTKRGVSGLNVTVYDAVISSRSEETPQVLAQFHPRVEAGWWSRARLGHQQAEAPRPPLWRLNGNINIQAGRGVEPSPSTLSTSPHCAELRATEH